MNQTAVMEELEEVFRKVFFDDAIELRREHTAIDIGGWDSLSHVRLIMEMERHFSIALAAAEVAGLHDVGALADLIAAKR